MVYLSNAFSLQMQGENDCSSRRVTLDEAKSKCLSWQSGPYIDRDSEKDGTDAVLKFIAVSCVGHADIASVLSEMTGFDIPVNRVSVSLKPKDTLVVGQYVGTRLPEGATQLPEGAKIEWYIVSCRKAGEVARLDEMRADLADAAANFEWPEEGKKRLQATVEKHFPQYFEENAFD